MQIDVKRVNYVNYKVGEIQKIKRKYGFVVYLFYEEGKKSRQQHAGFLTKKEAETERAAICGALYNHTYQVFRGVTVAAFMDYWIENDLKQNARSYSTYYNYCGIVKNHILPAFGQRKMELITPADILALYQQKDTASHSVVEQIRTVLVKAFNYAVRMNIIPSNPAKDVRLPKRIGEMKQQYHKRAIDSQKTLTVDQVKLLIAKSKKTPIYLMVMFNALMGLRRSEIIGLKYSDIDYNNRTLRVERQLGRKVGSKREDFPAKTYTKQEIPPKTSSSVRTLPIPDAVFEAILQERVKYEKNRNRRSAQFQDEGYICCSSYGKPRSMSYHWKTFKQLLKKCNLPDIRWHDLRATYSTLLLKENISAKAVAKVMGHSREIITVDVYGDNRRLIADGVPELDAFIDRLIPRNNETLEKETLDTVVDVSTYVKQ